MTIWTHELLDALRMIGDPELDGAGLDAVPTFAGSDPLGARLKQWRARATGALPERAAEAEKHPFWTSRVPPMAPSELATAHDLFVAFGGEIGASLLLASLPNAYAAEAGAQVLTRTHELQSNTRRRIAETAQFVVEVLFPDPVWHYATAVEPHAGDPLPPGSRGYIRARTTRLTHAVVRSLVTDWVPTESARVPARLETPQGVVIHQEDLLGTLGTFTVTVFDVMEKLGVPWTDEAESAYLQVWDRVGELLGIGTEAVVASLPKALRAELPEAYRSSLRPKTPREARDLMELIRERSWPIPILERDLGPFASEHGRVLVRALLDELDEAMPAGMERVPIFVMRYLVDPRAQELLGLGGGGLMGTLLQLPRQRALTRRPGRDLGRTAVQGLMRLLANDISRRSFVYFMRESRADGAPKFWFPVVEATTVPQGRAPT